MGDQAERWRRADRGVCELRADAWAGAAGGDQRAESGVRYQRGWTWTGGGYDGYDGYDRYDRYDRYEEPDPCQLLL